MPFAEVDINRDGYLDPAEVLALFDVAGLSLLSEDRNGDGLLSRRELLATQARGNDEGARTADVGRGSERNARNRPDSLDRPALSQAEDRRQRVASEPADAGAAVGEVTLDLERDLDGSEKAFPANGEGDQSGAGSDAGHGPGSNQGPERDLEGSDRNGRASDLDAGVVLGDTTNVDRGNDRDRGHGNDPDRLDESTPGRPQDEDNGVAGGPDTKAGKSQADNNRGGPRNGSGSRGEPRGSATAPTARD